jgi:hypothetical protein
MTETKKKNGQQKANETLALFDLWEESMSNEDFSAIVRRGHIKRTEIIKACGCGRPALTQNPRLIERIEKLENRLREKGVLPPESSSDTKKCGEDTSFQFNQNVSKQRHQNEHLSHLEQENQSLKAKIQYLEGELSRYQELSDSLYELGNLTR